MKKQLSAVSLLLSVSLAASLLTGCGAHGETGPDTAPTGGEDGAAQASDELRPLGTGLDAGNTQGRLATLATGDGDGSSVLYWVDYAGEQCVPLCTDPSCAHSDETCTAWLPGGVSAVSLPDGGVLKEQLNFDEASGDASVTLIRCAADGGGPHTLATIEANSIDLLAANSEAVWFDRLDAGSDQMSICRLPLTGGEPQVLYSYSLNDSPLFLGCDARRLVYMRTDHSIYDRISETGSGASEAEPDALRQEAANAELAREVFFVDADTGAETPFLQWDAQDVDARWQDGTLWRSTVENGEGVLRWASADGTGGEARYAWPGRELTGESTGNMMPYIEGVVEGQVLLRMRFMTAESIDDPAVEAGYDDPVFEWERIALDPAASTVAPLTLGYVVLGDGSFPVELLGRSGADLFVKFEEQRPFDPSMDPHGGQGYYTQCRCGLLAGADLLANRPNYREITVPQNIQI